MKERSKNDMKKIEYLEIARILATIAVVGIHIFYQSTLLFDPSDNRYFLPYNIFAFCVPLFLLISGAIQLNPDKEFKMKKSIKKVAIPLVSYGICFSILEQIFNNRAISIKYVFYAILNVIKGESWNHLWYIYMIIGVYLCMPYFKLIVKNSGANEYNKILLILFLFTSLIPSVDEFFNIKIAFNLPIESVYVFYLFWGYKLYNLDNHDINNKLLFILSIFNAVCLFFASQNEIRLPYNNIVTVCYVTSIFLILKKISNICNKIYNSHIEKVASCTFGIYIVHMIFVNFLIKFLKISIMDLKVNYYIAGIICTSLVFVISYIIVRIIKIIPGVNVVFRV